MTNRELPTQGETQQASDVGQPNVFFDIGFLEERFLCGKSQFNPSKYFSSSGSNLANPFAPMPAALIRKYVYPL